MKKIEINYGKCTGCRLCEMICSLVHEGVCSTAKSRIKITRDEEFGENKVFVCIHCAETYCIESCPFQAISRNPQTGALLIDDKLCSGCQACITACPNGGPFYDKEEEVVFKCDLCGGDPQCVKFCSREALTLKDFDLVQQ